MTRADFHHETTTTTTLTACETCDGTGCPCFRARDWQSMELGCECKGCPECGTSLNDEEIPDVT